eukprot:8946608-Alexandrium_andersonii.AAC.1
MAMSTAAFTTLGFARGALVLRGGRHETSARCRGLGCHSLRRGCWGGRWGGRRGSRTGRGGRGAVRVS